MHVWRRLSQIGFIIFIFLIPVFDIFRIDSGTRSLIVFGNEWGFGLNEGFYLDPSFANATHVAWRFFLKAVLPWLVILAIFPLLGALLGRFFCGWFCPEGALFELFDLLTVKIFGRRSLFTKSANDPDGPADNRLPYVLLAIFCIVTIPVLTGIALTGYFIDPGIIWGQIMQWNFTFGVKAGIIGVSIYVLVSSLIVRHNLCKYVCSAGLMQMLFGWVSPVSLRIKFDTSRQTACTDCKGCEKACFMKVKPRAPKRDINCVNCGECIAACNRELGQGKGLFSFHQPKTSLSPSKDDGRKCHGHCHGSEQLAKGG